MFLLFLENSVLSFKYMLILISGYSNVTHNVSVYLTKARGFNLGELDVKKCSFAFIYFYYLFIFTIVYANATVDFSSVEAQIIRTLFFSMSSMLPVLKHGSLQGLVTAQNGNYYWKAVQRKLWENGGVWLFKIQFL